MKWAIFEFEEDSSCDIGQTSWIQGEDTDSFDNDSWFFTKEVVVKWPKDFNKTIKMMQKDIDVDVGEIEVERYAARIVKFGDDYNAMKSCLATYVKSGTTVTPHKGRGHRVPVKNSRYEVENDDSQSGEEGSPVKFKRRRVTKKPNTVVSQKRNALLDMISDKYKTEKEVDKLANLEQEVKTIKQQCTEMKSQLEILTSTLGNLSEMPEAVKMLQVTVTKMASQNMVHSSNSSSSRPASPLSSTTSRSSSPAPSSSQPSPRQLNVENEDDELIDNNSDMVTICPAIKILPAQKELLALHGTPKLYTYALMEMVWSREVLATHSLTGKMSNAHKNKDPKPSLDIEKVASICDLVVKKFKLKDEKEVRAHFKAKLNNMERCMKIKKEH